MKRVDFAVLGEFDGGRLREAFEQAVSRLFADLQDRPALKAARRLTLRLALTPVCDESGHLDSVDLDYDIDEKIPRRKSKTYNARHDGHGLFVSLYAPEDARQRTIDEVIDREGVGHAG